MEIQSQINAMNSIQGGATQVAQKQVERNDQDVQENSFTTQETTSSTKRDGNYMPNMQEKTIIKAIEQANKKIEGSEKEFQFSVHEKTKQIMVKVIDKVTHQVVREIPSEKILDMVAAMCDAAGLFVDEKR